MTSKVLPNLRGGLSILANFKFYACFLSSPCYTMENFYSIMQIGNLVLVIIIYYFNFSK